MLKSDYTVNEKAYAKLNLSFKVLRRLPNNYHSIQSIVVFPSNIYDRISFNLSHKKKITIKGTFAKELLANGGDTLISKTLKEFSNYFSIPINLNIVLEKEIPIGSGLGGGSADAAATARAICKVFSLNYKKKEIINLLIRIGSDLPICFFSKNTLVSGIGNELHPIKRMNFRPWILIIKPPINISTRYVFNNFNGPFSKKINNRFNAKNLIKDMNDLKNPLEKVVKENFSSFSKLIDSLPKLKNITHPRMTGSGSSIFILFKTQNDAEKYLSEINHFTTNCWKRISQLNL